MASTTFRLGLTGGIGSGKSTVARLLVGLGASLIDADAISRRTTERNGSAIKGIRAGFGDSVLTEDGALNRDAMRSLVFSDPTARTRLEGIVHPLVTNAIRQQEQEAHTKGAHCIVFDIPLLVESKHWRASLGRVLVVDCTEATQVQRVTARDDLAVSAVQQIIAAQATRATRLHAADLIVFNNGISIEELEHHVREIGRQFGL